MAASPGRRLSMSLLLTAAMSAALVISACSTPEADGPAAPIPTAAEDATVIAAREKLVTAAKAEGTLTWYSAIPLAVDQAIAKAFTDKYGIKVEIFNVSSGALASKYSQERSANTVNADIINLADQTFYNTGNTNGWWVKLDNTVVPALASYPSKYKYSNNSVLIGTQPIGIAYNTNLVASPPKTWQDLLDPKYKGHILITDPTAVPAWMAMFKVWYDKLGPDFLTKLAAQSPDFVSSSNPGAQQVGAGEKWINIPTSLTALTDLKAKGAPVGFVYPQPTTGVEMTMSLSTKAAHPNAAALFVDFALSPEGQAQINKNTGASVLPGIPGTLEYPKDYVSPDVATAQSEKSKFLSPFGR